LRGNAVAGDQAADDRWLIEQLARQLHEVANPQHELEFEHVSDSTRKRYLRMGAEVLRQARWTAYRQSLSGSNAPLKTITLAPWGWPP